MGTLVPFVGFTLFVPALKHGANEGKHSSTFKRNLRSFNFHDTMWEWLTDNTRASGQSRARVWTLDNCHPCLLRVLFMETPDWVVSLSHCGSGWLVGWLVSLLTFLFKDWRNRLSCARALHTIPVMCPSALLSQTPSNSFFQIIMFFLCGILCHLLSLVVEEIMPMVSRPKHCSWNGHGKYNSA